MGHAHRNGSSTWITTSHSSCKSVAARRRHTRVDNSTRLEVVATDCYIRGLTQNTLSSQRIASIPPVSGEPVLKSALGWRDCQAKTVFKPTHTDQVADIVMSLYQDTQATGTKYLIRATHHEFFSHNNFSCSQEEAEVHAVVIDMSMMNSMVSLTDETITVQAGMTFQVGHAQLDPE